MLEKDRAADLRPRLRFDDLDLLMIYLLRSAAHFRKALAVLRLDHFRHDYEIGHRTIWAKAVEFHKRYGEPPSREVLEPSVMTELEHLGDGLVAGVSEDVTLFFATCYDGYNESKFNANFGFKLLKDFLHERNVLDPAQDFFNFNGRVPASINDIMRELNLRVTQTESVTSANTSHGIVPDELPDVDLMAVTPIGIDFLDVSLGGGRRNRESIGLLGALKAGKSTLGMQASVAAAQQELVRRGRDPSYEPAHSIYVSYEQSANNMQRKAIACAAKIEFDRVLLRKGWLDELSTAARPETLLPYDHALAADQPGVLGELERYNERVPPLAAVWRLIDHSGTRGNRAGDGYVEEIVAALENERQNGVKRFGLVVIDYALLCCRRYLRAHGLDETRHMRTRINSFGEDCRRLIAEAYDCTVLVLHQLSGEANKMSPTARVTHANAAEGAMFAENVSYCFELGTKDEKAGCVVLRCSAARHSDPPADPTILKYTSFSSLTAVNDEFFIDPISRHIVNRGDIGTFAASLGETASPAAARAGGPVRRSRPGRSALSRGSARNIM